MFVVFWLHERKMCHLTTVHLSNSFIMILSKQDAAQPAVIGHHRGKRAARETGSSKKYYLSFNNLGHIQVRAITFI